MAFDVSGCLNEYDNHGVLFEYPDIWELVEQPEEDGDILITVSTEGTCFWSLRILRSSPSPVEVVNSCVAAFREEYEDLDEYPGNDLLAGMSGSGRDLEFSCFELINSASLRSVQGPQFTVLVWWQGTDHELDEVRSVLEKMTQSVQIRGFLESRSGR